MILEEEKFRQTIQKAFDFVSRNNAICTLGMQPTRPETGYGYIQFIKDKQDELNVESLEFRDVYPVKTFTEKPNLEMAKVFLESGDFLWNSGIFIWNLQTISEAFRYLLPEVADRFREGELLILSPFCTIPCVGESVANSLARMVSVSAVSKTRFWSQS